MSRLQGALGTLAAWTGLVLKPLSTRPPSPLAAASDLAPYLGRRLGTPLRQGANESSEACARRVETALMVLFRETGAEEVYTALYRCTSAAMRTWVLHLCRGRGLRRDPLDMVQDTYVNIYRYAGSFRDGNGGFRAWARTIAANAVRRAGRASGGPACSDLASAVTEPIDMRPGPQATCQLAEQENHMRKAWAMLLRQYAVAWKTLSPRDQEALALVEIDGCSYDEAGRVLGVGRSNMKMIMFRARQRIRNRIRKDMGVAWNHGPEATLRQLLEA